MIPGGTIAIAAALLLRADGRTLLVRKRGTAAFMQAGGKIAPGESAIAALIRELDEELGLRIEAADVMPLGRFEAEAANEPGSRVAAELFLVETGATPVAAAEIEQLCWIDPARPGTLPLAPLTRNHVLPLAIALASRSLLS